MRHNHPFVRFVITPVTTVIGTLAEITIPKKKQPEVLEWLRGKTREMRADSARREYARQHNALLMAFLKTPRDSPAWQGVLIRIDDMAMLRDPYWVYVAKWLKENPKAGTESMEVDL